MLICSAGHVYCSRCWRRQEEASGAEIYAIDITVHRKPTCPGCRKVVEPGTVRTLGFRAGPIDENQEIEEMTEQLNQIR
jgi:hypothetical protein